MQDEYVKNCPFCGRNEMIKCHETGYTLVTAVNNVWVSLWEELLYIIPFEQILNELVSMNKVITSGATKGRRYIKNKLRSRSYSKMEELTMSVPFLVPYCRFDLIYIKSNIDK